MEGYMKDLRATPVGHNISNATDRKSKQNIRSTDQGKLNNQIQAKAYRDTTVGKESSNASDRKSKQTIRATETGGINQRIVDRNSKQIIRYKAKADHDEKIAKIPFPPEFPPEKTYLKLV